MGARFDSIGDDRIRATLPAAERAFLTDVLGMLGSIGDEPDDPGAARINPPAYLGDDEAAAEWRRLMGSQLEDSRSRDREALARIIELGEAALEPSEALSVLRVVNEARLVLAARLGVEVPDDYEDLDLGSSIALHVLGVLVEDLAEALSDGLD